MIMLLEAKAGIDYCKYCKSKSLFDTQDDNGNFITVCNDCGKVQQMPIQNKIYSKKEYQFKVIQKHNPAPDDYHAWIRSCDDIKTFDEALRDSDFDGWETQGFDPSYTADMAKTALRKGTTTVFSPYPIDLGVFVTPSKMEAESYAGGRGYKIYSKQIGLSDVAWIDPTQGIYTG